MKRILFGLAVGLALATTTMATPAQAADCDRPCLASMLDRYLAAIVAHDPGKAPLFMGFRQTQNAIVIPRGKGLWQDATALGPVQRRFYDPVTGTAAYFGTLELGAEKTIASLRLHVRDGEISEAEWHVTRATDSGIIAGDKAVFDVANLIANPPPVRTVPKDKRLSREALIAITNSYFDGVTNANADIIMAHPGCLRLENGMRVTGNKLPPERAHEGFEGKSDCTSGQGQFNIALVSGRRYPLVDEDAQVVLAIATFIRSPGVPKRRNHFMEFFYIDDAGIREVYAAFIYPDPALPVPNWPPYDGNFPLPADFGPTR